MEDESFSPPAYLQASPDLLKKDARRRVERLLAGERRTDDLTRLFLDLRARVGPDSCVREVGDFLAHRSERDRGVTMNAAQDFHTGARGWLAAIRAGSPNAITLEQFAEVARANLRRATPEQILRGCRLSRTEAKASLERAIKRLGSGGHVTKRDARTFDFLAGRFIWNQAFDDETLLGELVSALTRSGALLASEITAFSGLKTFVALFAISQMHLGAVATTHGPVALFADFDNSRSTLWVRAQIVIEDLGKPIYMPLCVFNTSIDGPSHCDVRLSADPDTWRHTVEVMDGIRLAPI